LLKKVLLVDDEQNALVALSKILREDGYDVAIAGTEEQAISSLDRGNFDFIITDLFLFHRSCVNLLNKIKSLEVRTPVILTSGHEDVERYIEESQPMDIMHLSKPIAYDKLKRLIEKMETHREVEDTSDNDSPEELTKSKT
jgi:two-component system nitrogen regulation response regulator GlnG